MSTTRTPVRTRVELRPLPGGRTLLTTAAGRHFTLGVAAADAVRLLDAVADPAHASAALPDGWEDGAQALADLLVRVGDVPAAAGPAVDAPAPVALPADERWVLHGEPDVVAAVVGALDPDATRGTDPRVEVVTGPLHDAVHRAFAARAVLLVAARGHVATSFVAADRACADARLPWVPVVVERARVEVGPWVTPGVGTQYEDLLARRVAAGPDEDAERALVTPSLTGDAGPAPADLPVAVAAAVRALAGDPGLRGGDVVVTVTADGTVTPHPVLPLPGPSRTHRPRTPAAVVDPTTGIVTRVRTIAHHPSVPASLATVQADVCTMRRVSRWANSTSCQGSAFGDPEAARAAALGEAVERYCGNMLDTLPVEHGSWTELSHRGIGRVLHPDDLVLYSPTQHATPGFPFVPLTPDLPVHWVPGRSLTRDEPVWVPASMVYVNWFTAGYSAAPVTNFCPFAGIAAGPTWEFAVTSALEEVVERHATMVWWLNGQPLDAVDPGPELTAVWDDVRAHGQRPGLIALDNEFGIPVAAGVLWNDQEQLLNIGFSARADLRTAALKAWTEALTLQEGSRDLLPADGRHWAAMRRGALNGRSFKPWRADRRYLDDFRPDMRDCDDLMVQQQVHLDPRAVERVRPVVDTPVRRTLADVPSLPARALPHYLERVHAVGHEVVVVDITSADVAATGMRVVRVIVPGTVGNAPAAFPFLGHGRVQDLAVELGWRDRPLAEHELAVLPLPHA